MYTKLLLSARPLPSAHLPLDPCTAACVVEWRYHILNDTLGPSPKTTKDRNYASAVRAYNEQCERLKAEVTSAVTAERYDVAHIAHMKLKQLESQNPTV
jgi:hypothetical protein